MPTKPMPQQERLLRATTLAPDTGCWEWQLTRDHAGYGRMKISMGSRELFRFTSAHRYAHEVFIGPIPEGLHVLHRCDNRRCCNPQHLFLGTRSDNMKDMYAKGRGPKGYKRKPKAIAATQEQT